MSEFLEKIIFYSKHRYFALVVLLAIVLLGGILRAYKLNANPFVADEFLDINSAYGYHKTHVWQAWDFNLGKPDTADVFAPRDERAWTYKWQVAQLFRFFPLNETTARSVSVAWGIISIFVVYWAASYFTRKKSIGLLSAFLFAVSVTAISFDRKLRMYAMFYPLYLLMSLFLFQFFEASYRGKISFIKFFFDKFKVNLAYLGPLALAAFVSLSIQPLTVNIFPVFLVYVLIQAIILARQKNYFNKYSAVLSLTILISAGIYIIASQTVHYYSGVLKFFIKNQYYLIRIWRDYNNYLLALIFLVAGLYFLTSRKQSKEAWWLSVSFFVPLLMAAFLWKRAQGIQYVFFLQSFLIIMVAAGIYFWAEFFKNNLPKYSQKAFLGVVVLALLLLPNYGYFFSSDTTYRRDISQIADYRKVFTYIKRNLKLNDVIITRNFRNYYLKGKGVKVFDFGGERAKSNLSLSQIQEIQNQNPTGWVVLFDNDSDFLTKDALHYIKQNFTKIDNSSLVRGASAAYRWGI